MGRKGGSTGGGGSDEDGDPTAPKTYEVIFIKESRIREGTKGVVEYRCRWKNYDACDDWWKVGDKSADAAPALLVQEFKGRLPETQQKFDHLDHLLDEIERWKEEKEILLNQFRESMARGDRDVLLFYGGLKQKYEEYKESHIKPLKKQIRQLQEDLADYSGGYLNATEARLPVACIAEDEAEMMELYQETQQFFHWDASERATIDKARAAGKVKKKGKKGSTTTSSSTTSSSTKATAIPTPATASIVPSDSRSTTPQPPTKSTKLKPAPSSGSSVTSAAVSSTTTIRKTETGTIKISRSAINKVTTPNTTTTNSTTATPAPVTKTKGKSTPASKPQSSSAIPPVPSNASVSSTQPTSVSTTSTPSMTKQPTIISSSLPTRSPSFPPNPMTASSEAAATMMGFTSDAQMNTPPSTAAPSTSSLSLISSAAASVASIASTTKTSPQAKSRLKKTVAPRVSVDETESDSGESENSGSDDEKESHTDKNINQEENTSKVPPTTTSTPLIPTAPIQKKSQPASPLPSTHSTTPPAAVPSPAVTAETKSVASTPTIPMKPSPPAPVVPPSTTTRPITSSVASVASTSSTPANISTTSKSTTSTSPPSNVGGISTENTSGVIILGERIVKDDNAIRRLLQRPPLIRGTSTESTISINSTSSMTSSNTVKIPATKPTTKQVKSSTNATTTTTTTTKPTPTTLTPSTTAPTSVKPPSTLSTPTQVLTPTPTISATPNSTTSSSTQPQLSSLDKLPPPTTPTAPVKPIAPTPSPATIPIPTSTTPSVPPTATSSSSIEVSKKRPLTEPDTQSTNSTTIPPSSQGEAKKARIDPTNTDKTTPTTGSTTVATKPTTITTKRKRKTIQSSSSESESGSSPSGSGSGSSSSDESGSDSGTMSDVKKPRPKPKAAAGSTTSKSATSAAAAKSKPIKKATTPAPKPNSSKTARSDSDSSTVSDSTEHPSDADDTRPGSTDGTSFSVNRLLDVRDKGGPGESYLVKWNGWIEPSWEPKSNIKAKVLISDLEYRLERRQERLAQRQRRRLKQKMASDKKKVSDVSSTPNKKARLSEADEAAKRFKSKLAESKTIEKQMNKEMKEKLGQLKSKPTSQSTPEPTNINQPVYKPMIPKKTIPTISTPPITTPTISLSVELPPTTAKSNQLPSYYQQQPVGKCTPFNVPQLQKQPSQMTPPSAMQLSRQSSLESQASISSVASNHLPAYSAFFPGPSPPPLTSSLISPHQQYSPVASPPPTTHVATTTNLFGSMATSTSQLWQQSAPPMASYGVGTTSAAAADGRLKSPPVPTSTVAPTAPSPHSNRTRRLLVLGDEQLQLTKWLTSSWKGHSPTAAPNLLMDVNINEFHEIHVATSLQQEQIIDRATARTARDRFFIRFQTGPSQLTQLYSRTKMTDPAYFDLVFILVSPYAPGAPSSVTQFFAPTPFAKSVFTDVRTGLVNHVQFQHWFQHTIMTSLDELIEVPISAYSQARDYPFPKIKLVFCSPWPLEADLVNKLADSSHLRLVSRQPATGVIRLGLFSHNSNHDCGIDLITFDKNTKAPPASTKLATATTLPSMPPSTTKYQQRQVTEIDDGGSEMDFGPGSMSGYMNTNQPHQSTSAASSVVDMQPYPTQPMDDVEMTDAPPAAPTRINGKGQPEKQATPSKSVSVIDFTGDDDEPDSSLVGQPVVHPYRSSVAEKYARMFGLGPSPPPTTGLDPFARPCGSCLHPNCRMGRPHHARDQLPLSLSPNNSNHTLMTVGEASIPDMNATFLTVDSVILPTRHLIPYTHYRSYYSRVEHDDDSSVSTVGFSSSSSTDPMAVESIADLIQQLRLQYQKLSDDQSNRTQAIDDASSQLPYAPSYGVRYKFDTKRAALTLDYPAAAVSPATIEPHRLPGRTQPFTTVTAPVYSSTHVSAAPTASNAYSYSSYSTASSGQPAAAASHHYGPPTTPSSTRPPSAPGSSRNDRPAAAPYQPSTPTTPMASGVTIAPPLFNTMPSTASHAPTTQPLRTSGYVHPGRMGLVPTSTSSHEPARGPISISRSQAQPPPLSSFTVPVVRHERGPCRYYAIGQCRKGASCEFSHNK